MVLFYLTIGLTVNYSLRLVYCLFSSTSHFAVTTRISGVISSCKFPLWALRGISIFGGQAVISKYVIGVCVACATDKRLFIGIALLGTVIGSKLRRNTLKCTSPRWYLGISTSFLRSGQRSFNYFFALEKSPIAS